MEAPQIILWCVEQLVQFSAYQQIPNKKKIFEGEIFRNTRNIQRWVT